MSQQLPLFQPQGIGESEPLVVAAQEPTRKWTLGTLRVWLRARLDKGQRCPCCHQLAKVYKRPLNSSMAYVLALMSRAPLELMDGRGYFHVPSYLNGAARLRPEVSAAVRGDWAKLVHWDLIEAQRAKREDGGSQRNGRWRVTPAGLAFVEGSQRVMSHVKIYDGVRVGLAGDMVTIKEALGKKFNYEEIMADAGDNLLPELRTGGTD